MVVGKRIVVVRGKGDSIPTVCSDAGVDGNAERFREHAIDGGCEVRIRTD